MATVSSAATSPTLKNPAAITSRFFLCRKEKEGEMKIWQVSENDTQIRFYWFATRKEADVHARNYANDTPGHLAKIEPIEFDSGRTGLVKALNWVISMTCFNEG
jgi:hypothetical protein